jgi:hypothetical protein
VPEISASAAPICSSSSASGGTQTAPATPSSVV